MELGLGAILALAGISAVGGLGSSGIQFASNKKLQEMAQEFNAEEALKSRDFTSLENAINRDFNANQALLNREFSSAEAEKARQFTLEMDNTKYQRQVADMQAAGLNPAALMGSAHTPVVAQATSGTGAFYNSSGGAAVAGSPGASISAPSLVSSALEYAITQKLTNDKKLFKEVVSTAKHAANISINKTFNAINKFDNSSVELTSHQQTLLNDFIANIS